MRSAPLLALALLLAGCGAPPTPAPEDPVRTALGGDDTAGYARALAPRPFRFPADHGPHPAFRNEWWYLTGNLAGPDGGRFGFQVTWFRIALAPDAPERGSPWATRQLWMAHLALTDAAAERHLAAERFARGALGLAGAEAEPLRVWLEDWSLAETAPDRWRLAAAAAGFALDLEFVPERDPVLQGDAGLSRKSAAPGNASYYYSIPRIAVRGTVIREGRPIAVSGSAWLDREWSTSALGPDQVGWDWFALQLDDGSELMYYQLRRDDGSADPHSAGSWSGAGRETRGLGPESVRLEPLRWWRSERGKRYPVAWRMTVAGRALEVRPLIDRQEMALTLTYWEGAVEVFEDGRHVGWGYLELAGY